MVTETGMWGERYSNVGFDARSSPLRAPRHARVIAISVAVGMLPALGCSGDDDRPGTGTGGGSGTANGGGGQAKGGSVGTSAGGSVTAGHDSGAGGRDGGENAGAGGDAGSGPAAGAGGVGAAGGDGPIVAGAGGVAGRSSGAAGDASALRCILNSFVEIPNPAPRDPLCVAKDNQPCAQQSDCCDEHTCKAPPTVGGMTGSGGRVTCMPGTPGCPFTTGGTLQSGGSTGAGGSSGNSTAGDANAGAGG